MGHHHKHSSKQPPNKPTATTRRYIRWHTTETHKTEPTSTLVLTTPLGHFVDIRVKLPTALSTSDFPVPLVHSSLITPVPNVLPTSSLDWAFAGTTQLGEPQQDGRRHCKWLHFVDSRTTNGEDVNDEGFLREEVTDPDALGGRTVWESETGEGLDASGLLAGYEEGWLPVPVILTRDGVDAFPGRDDAVSLLEPEEDELSEVEVVTLRLQDPDGDGVRGMVVRVGWWCQGVFRGADGAFQAERWWFDGGRWERLLRVGDETADGRRGRLTGALQAAMDPAELVEGRTPQFGDDKWNAVELSKR
ncbi:MAG: hypothetical protein Q9162_002969 [Coniocarpon cinnabarinum]